jgi:hypothetical protein
MLFNALIVLMLTLVTVLKEELLKKKWWRLYMAAIKGGAALVHGVQMMNKYNKLSM